MTETNLISTVVKRLKQLMGLVPTRKGLRRKGYDQNRVEERPYKDLSDKQVKRRYVQNTGQVRDADKAGMHLSPLIDKGVMMSKEWRKRGNDSGELDEALREAGYDV